MRFTMPDVWRAFPAEKRALAKLFEYQRLTLPIEVTFPRDILGRDMNKHLCQFCFDYSPHASPMGTTARSIAW